MMKLYDITETPLKIYGLAVADSEKRQFFKLSEEASNAISRAIGA